MIDLSINAFRNHIFNIHMYKIGFGIKWPTMIDMPSNQTKPISIGGLKHTTISDTLLGLLLI